MNLLVVVCLKYFLFITVLYSLLSLLLYLLFSVSYTFNFISVIFTYVQIYVIKTFDSIQ